MNVAIIGAGAIGGLMAEAFARGGQHVSLVARGEHLRGLREHGLRVRSGPDAASETTYRLNATDDPASLGVQDVIVIALKAYAVGPMLAQLAPQIGPDTVVIPAINGLPWWYFERHPMAAQFANWRIDCLDPAGEYVRALDSRHLMGCVVHAAAEVIAPGCVQSTAGKLYFLGELDGSESPRVMRIAQALRDGGSDARVSPRIRNDIWMKLIGNMSYNPIAALTLARMNDINGNDALLACIRTQMLEAMAVAEHYGEPITMSVDERIKLARTIGASKISMHQDIERGRPLEIDAIVTSVLELAAKAKIETPMITTIHALIAERAKHS
jgi:2-dehydropantoate 2-reductase